MDTWDNHLLIREVAALVATAQGGDAGRQRVVEAACGSSAAEVGRSRGKAKAVACSGVPDGTALDEGDVMESLVFMVRAYGDA